MAPSSGEQALRRTKRSLNATESGRVVSDSVRACTPVCSLFFFYVHTLLLTVKAESVQPQDRPAMSEEEVERRSKSIIDEFLHINDYKVLNA